MKWSYTRPKQGGYYWFRDSKRGIYEQVVEVVAAPKMGLLAQQELQCDGDPITAIPKTSEWAGPIPRPSSK